MANKPNHRVEREKKKQKKIWEEPHEIYTRFETIMDDGRKKREKLHLEWTSFAAMYTKYLSCEIKLKILWFSSI